MHKKRERELFLTFLKSDIAGISGSLWEIIQLTNILASVGFIPGEVEKFSIVVEEETWVVIFFLCI